MALKSNYRVPYKEYLQPFRHLIDENVTNFLNHPPTKATTTSQEPISEDKNFLGNLGTLACYIALKPFYDKITINTINGAGPDLFLFKDGKRTELEAKNWQQYYRNHPSLTPNKYETEVKPRFSKEGHRKISALSALFSRRTKKQIEHDHTIIFQFPRQILTPKDFHDAVVSLRYQEAFRLQVERNDGRLFNNTTLSHVEDAMLTVRSLLGWSQVLSEPLPVEDKRGCCAKSEVKPKNNPQASADIGSRNISFSLAASPKELENRHLFSESISEDKSIYRFHRYVEGMR